MFRERPHKILQMAFLYKNMAMGDAMVILKCVLFMINGWLVLILFRSVINRKNVAMQYGSLTTDNMQ